MKKIIWTGLAAGIAMAIINIALNPVLNAIFPELESAYMNPVFRPWSDPVMSLFFLYPIILGIGLAFIWDKTKTLFTKGVGRNGFNFGLIYFFVVGIPIFLINFSSFNLPFNMILCWTIMSIVNGFVAGWILAAVNKK